MSISKYLIWIFVLSINGMFTAIASADTFIPYGKPAIDGTISDNEWPDASHIRLARFYGFDQYSDIWLQWDDDNLYLAGILQDQTLFEDGKGTGSTPFIETWHDDSLEFYFHPTDNLPAQVNESSRILAFTPTGRFHRLDRGKWSEEQDNIVTTALETLTNTTARINDQPFFNQAISQNWVCPVEQTPAPKTNTPVIIKFNSQQNPQQDWRFELAIPWQLLGTKVSPKVLGANCAIGNGIFPSRLNPVDGLPLHLNFFRVGDDDGGDALPHGGAYGVLKDEWTVFQGDRHRPQEWARFVLSDQRLQHSGPVFSSKALNVNPVSTVDGRRARLTFKAPQRSNSDISVAKAYVVHYGEGNVNVNADNWNNLTVFQQSVPPLAPGQQQSLDVINLEPGKTYTFALRAVDEAGTLSKDILSASLSMPNDKRSPFITVAPTGRSLVFSNAKPFVVAAETALMPWIPLRGLYDQELCDEYPPLFLLIQPADYTQGPSKPCGGGILDPSGKVINGLLRNYATENVFYTCHFTDGSTKGIARLTALDNPVNNCSYNESRKLDTSIKNNPSPDVGPKLTEEFFNKLKNNGVNVLTVFVESLDLKVTPIMFEPNDPGNQQTNDAALRFLDRLLDLAQKHDVYLLFRLYDTFYYKDSNYKGQNRKWSDTFWYKQLGKKNPDNFFDEDLYSYHQKRMKVLFERYRDNPNVMGWDLLNEVDNKGHFNAASIDKRKKWLQSMLAYAKSMDHNHLMFYSFLTWEPKDDSYYRASINDKLGNGAVMSAENFIGMDASLAYRLENADLAMPHGYYPHVTNPWDRGSADFDGPQELARGISYGFTQIRDGRPIIDGESTPDSHAFNKFYGDDGFTEAVDDRNFYRSAWLHFVSGGAGANMRWPGDLKKTDNNANNQISSTKRSFLKTFIQHVGNLSWQGDQLQISQTKNPQDNSRQFTRTDGKTAITYVYNGQGVSLKSVQLSGFDVGTKANVRAINPETGELLFQEDNASLNANEMKLLQPVSGDIAFIMTDIVEAKVAASLNSNFELNIPHVVYTDATGNALRLTVKFKLMPSTSGDLAFGLSEFAAVLPKSSRSETVNVDSNLNLHIPRLVFEANGKKQFFWAKLKGSIFNGQILFNVQSYGQL